MKTMTVSPFDKFLKDFKVPNEVIQEKTGNCDIHGETTFTSFMGGEFGCKKCKDIESEKKQQEELRKQATEMRHFNLATNGIDKDMKGFDDWIYDQSENQKSRQEKMIAALKRYSNNFEKTLPNILLVGGTGSGKTMLSNAICYGVFNKCYSSRNHTPCHMVTSAQVTQMVKAGWKDPSKPTEQDILRRLASYDLLVIDDLGDADTSIGEMAQQDRNRLGQILAMRYQNAPTIITTNLTEEQAKQFIGDRAWDRLQENLVIIRCDWTSHRQKTAKVSYL